MMSSWDCDAAIASLKAHEAELMPARSPIPRLTDMVEACTLNRSDMHGVTLDAFEADIRKR